MLARDPLESKLPPRAWLTVGLLCVVAILDYVDRNMITTMHRSIVAAVPMTEAQFGLLTSIFLWVYGILCPFAGYLADRFSRSRMIIGSLFIWSAMTWLTGHAKTFEQLLIARAIMGISEAGYIATALALIADYHRGPTRSRANSLHVMAVVAGSGLSGIGGWSADRYPWGASFRVLGIAGAAYALVLLLLLRDRPEAAEASRGISGAESPPAVRLTAALKSVLTTPAFLLALAAYGILGLVGWLLVGWAPTFFQEKFHLSQGQAGFSAAGFLSLSTFVGAFIGGILADKWQLRNPRGRILIAVVGLLLAAPGLLLMNLASTLGLAVAGLILYGLTRIFVDANMMPIVCLVVDVRYRATGFGVLTLCACCVGGIGIYAGGLLRDAHTDLGRLFGLAVVALLVSAGLFSLVRPSPRRESWNP